MSLHEKISREIIKMIRYYKYVHMKMFVFQFGFAFEIRNVCVCRISVADRCSVVKFSMWRYDGEIVSILAIDN